MLKTQAHLVKRTFPQFSHSKMQSHSHSKQKPTKKKAITIKPMRVKNINISMFIHNFLFDKIILLYLSIKQKKNSLWALGTRGKKIIDVVFVNKTALRWICKCIFMLLHRSELVRLVWQPWRLSKFRVALVSMTLQCSISLQFQSRHQSLERIWIRNHCTSKARKSARGTNKG